MKDNKLIAEFMGIEVKDDDAYLDEIKAMRKSGIHIDFNGYTTSELKYHTSWDWLMPVIQEIDFLQYEPIQRIEDALATRCIGDTYNAVVEFIKEYNDEKRS